MESKVTIRFIKWFQRYRQMCAYMNFETNYRSIRFKLGYKIQSPEAKYSQIPYQMVLHQGKHLPNLCLLWDILALKKKIWGLRYSYRCVNLRPCLTVSKIIYIAILWFIDVLWFISWLCTFCKPLMCVYFSFLILYIGFSPSPVVINIRHCIL